MSREKLVQTAKKCKELLINESFLLDFTNFVGVKGVPVAHTVIDHHKLEGTPLHECGTSFCLAGALAHLDNYPDEYCNDNLHRSTFDYLDYSSNLIGCDYRFADEEWDFIFGGYCPNDKELAIKRMDYIIDNNGEIPETSEWGNYGY